MLVEEMDVRIDDIREICTPETGIDVTLDAYDSVEMLLAKLKQGGGGYDIVVAIRSAREPRRLHCVTPIRARA